MRGYADAADWVYRQAISRTGLSHPHEILTLAEVRNIHYQAMQPVRQVAPHPDATSQENPGSFREHDIHPFSRGMVPVSWPLISAQMNTWLGSVNSLDPTHPEFAEALARTHCRFEQIHPFLDGNGRTGRLVLNLILVRVGYPPAVVYKRDRARYLRALQRADEGEPGPLGEILARAILASLHRFVIPAVAGPARLVPLAALETPDLNGPALRGGGGTRAAPRHPCIRRPLAQYAAVG